MGMISLVLLSWASLVDAQGKLAYTGCGGICIMDPLPGATPEPLVERFKSNSIWYMDLSPDGEQVAFTHVTGDPFSWGCVYAMKRDGTDLRDLVCQNTHRKKHISNREGEGTDYEVLLIYDVRWSPMEVKLPTLRTAVCDLLPRRNILKVQKHDSWKKIEK